MRIKTNDKYASIMLKNSYENAKNEITLTAVLNTVYAEKISSETIQTKVTNQLNSIETSIHQINPKFNENAKNYNKIREQMMETLNRYEENLKQFCQICDAEIQECVLKKVELESKLLMAVITKEYLYQKDKKEQKIVDTHKIKHGIHQVVEKIKTKAKQKEQVDVSLIHQMQDGKEVEKEIEEELQFSQEYKDNRNWMQKLEKEIKKLNGKINHLNEQKIKKVFDAMEAGNKAISTQIRKPRTLKKITRFFANRFNTYNVIIKSVIEPINHRIDEFQVNVLKKVDIKNEEFNLQEIERKIQEKQDLVLKQKNYKSICEKMGVL